MGAHRPDPFSALVSPSIGRSICHGGTRLLINCFEYGHNSTKFKKMLNNIKPIWPLNHLSTKTFFGTVSMNPLLILFFFISKKVYIKILILIIIYSLVLCFSYFIYVFLWLIFFIFQIFKDMIEKSVIDCEDEIKWI